MLDVLLLAVLYQSLEGVGDGAVDLGFLGGGFVLLVLIHHEFQESYELKEVVEGRLANELAEGLKDLLFAQHLVQIIDLLFVIQDLLQLRRCLVKKWIL